MKKFLSLLMILLLQLTILAACGTTKTPTETPASSTPLTLTIEELAKYDGTNGNKAYIAIDGKIYDVTDIAPWKGGNHHGYTAGKDLTNEIKTVAPHGMTPIEKLTPIGTIKK